MSFLLSKEESCPAATSRTANYNGIDLVKFLCAIAVFIIHVSPLPDGASALSDALEFGLRHCLCRIAVPFYFICTGFFLFGKMPLHELNIEVIKNYCFKILRLLGIWSVLLVIGETGHLWYLGATVTAIILLSLCLRSGISLRCICLLACLLYAIGLLGDSYYGVVAPLENITPIRYLFGGYRLAFTTTCNGVFMGFIFILTGVICSKYRFRIKPSASLLGLLVSLLCLLAEGFLLRQHNIPADHNMYIFLLPAAFFLFSFARALPLKDHAVYKHLRGIGMLIYFSHLFINKLVSLALGAAGTYLHTDLMPFRFLISLSATLLIKTCLELLSHKAKFQWIKWLLS